MKAEYTALLIQYHISHCNSIAPQVNKRGGHIYKLVFQCLGYYGLHRKTIRKHVFTTKSGICDKDGESKGSALKWIAKFRSSNSNSHLREDINCEENIEYVLDEPENNDEHIFGDYYDDRVKNHHNYTNIDEMSEYI